jgi:hypothetical protein
MNPLVAIGVRILEILFFAGWIGAAIVILLAGGEDLHTIMGEKTEDQH